MSGGWRVRIEARQNPRPPIFLPHQRFDFRALKQLHPPIHWREVFGALAIGCSCLKSLVSSRLNLRTAATLIRLRRGLAANVESLALSDRLMRGGRGRGSLSLARARGPEARRLACRGAVKTKKRGDS